MTIPTGGPPGRGKRPQRPKIITRNSSGRSSKSGSGRSSGASSPLSLKSKPSPLTPVEPVRRKKAAPEIAGEPVSNRRVSFVTAEEGRRRGADLFMTRPSADILMSMDLAAPQNKGEFADQIPVRPQIATPHRFGIFDDTNAKTFSDLIRRVEYRPGEKCLVEKDKSDPYRFLVSAPLARTDNSQGLEVTILDQLQPVSAWAKVTRLDENGNIPEQTLIENQLLFEIESPMRPVLALLSDQYLYTVAPEMFGDGLKLFEIITTVAAQNEGNFTAALPFLRNTVGNLLEELAYIHEKDIYHRDIKADNFMFADDGMTTLIDFGTAHKGKAVGHVASTPGYLAPNLFDGRPVDPAKADVFALGATFMVLYSGQMPFLNAELVAWQAASSDLSMMRADPDNYEEQQSNKELREETLAEKQAKLDVAKAAVAKAIVEYKGAYAAMIQYIDARNSGREDEPLPNLGRPAWTAAFATLVERDFAIAPLLVGMLAPTNKHRLSAEEAYSKFQKESLEAAPITQGAMEQLYKQHTSALRKTAQERSTKELVSLQNSIKANSPLFDEPQLENQPTVQSLKEAKEHILNMATDVYHSVEEVLPGTVTKENYETLASARKNPANRRTIDQEELEEVMRQVREATPPKIAPVSNVRGVKRIRDIFIKVR